MRVVRFVLSVAVLFSLIFTSCEKNHEIGGDDKKKVEITEESGQGKKGDDKAEGSTGSDENDDPENPSTSDPVNPDDSSTTNPSDPENPSTPDPVNPGDTDGGTGNDGPGNGTQLPVDSPRNITLYVDGVDIPPVSSEAWEKFQGTDNDMKLSWTEGCGWYDCNKSEPAQGGKDSEMCWAAAASNLLHWWIDRNRNHIDKLNIEFPQEYKSDIKSDIFELYRTTVPLFGNKKEGENPVRAMNWFINGFGFFDSVAGGRYFKDILGEDISFAEVKAVNEKFFTNDITEALQNKCAIAFSIKHPRNYSYTHELTLWGAEYGEDGRISHILYTENNDVAEGPVLIRKAIRYEHGNIYLESYISGVFALYLYDLHILHQADREWTEAMNGR